MSTTTPLSVILLSAAPAVAATSMVPLPEGAPQWVQWLAVVVGACAGPALTIFANKVAPRFLAGRRAKKEALALAKERRAKQLREDNDNTNDATATKLEDEADALRAEAAELDAISGAVRLSGAAQADARAAMKKHGVGE